ncbi:MAG: MlaD family protein [Thermoanaerobaculia bacterium]
MGANTSSRTRWTGRFGRWLGLGCLLVTLACRAGLTFTVTFNEVDGLEPGDAVVYKGLDIGKVREITLTRSGPIEVELGIYREHRQLLYREARFLLERTVTGGHRIAVYDTEGPRTPIEGGEVVAGRRAPLGELMGKVRNLGRDLVTEGAERLSGQIDAWRERLGDSREEVDLVESARDYAERAAEMSREQLERFRREELPELERRAARVRRWLEEQGHKADAERFWRDFRDWIESVGDGAGEEQVGQADTDAGAGESR